MKTNDFLAKFKDDLLKNATYEDVNPQEGAELLSGYFDERLISVLHVLKNNFREFPDEIFSENVIWLYLMVITALYITAKEEPGPGNEAYEIASDISLSFTKIANRVFKTSLNAIKFRPINYSNVRDLNIKIEEGQIVIKIGPDTMGDILLGLKISNN